MIFQQLNASDPEKIFGLFTNNEGANVPADAVCQLDISTAVDGNKIVQPNSNELNAVVGVADATISSAGATTGLVQLYGYRGTSKLLLTDTTQAAGARLVASAGQDYLRSSGSGDLLFVLLESHTTGTGTVSKKIHVRCL